MERETGIEPATSSLGSWRSTAELLPLTWLIQQLTRCGFDLIWFPHKFPHKRGLI